MSAEPLTIEAQAVSDVHDATYALSSLACVLTWAARGFREAPTQKGRPHEIDEFSHSVEWIGDEIERQCTKLMEAI